ncbi:sodium channel protein type 4 subunit alpha B-like isoform X2 [Dunckerocampus dactyliophorus]|nr:sodium channel protein type 4 subunit alpha B-like isoform X2 [Dunckerocampus dactyliophorus]
MQNARIGPLLPPLGTEVFRHFTAVSLEEIQQRLGEKKKKERREDDNMEVTQEHRNPAGDLESGKLLPSIYGEPPLEFVTTPLEDLDPFYQSQKTFLVLSKGKTISRFNADPACYLLSPFNLVRTTAIKILLHSFFRLFILLTVVINCVLMTMTKPPAWSKCVVYTIIAIYASEMLIKVAARGLCVGRFTFLRNPWNWLDVMVIATAYLTAMLDSGTLSVFQVLPALKIIPLIPGLKATIGALVQSLKKLTSITILTILFLSAFALVAQQLFMGTLRQKCVLMPTQPFRNLSAAENLTSDFDFDKYINNRANHYYLPGSNDALLCGNSSDAGLCPEGFLCLKTGGNPNWGYTSYDSFGWAFLALFRLMTLDFWENLMELTLRADGKSYTVFFVVVIVLVSYHLVALIVAVMAMAYAEQRQGVMAEAKQKHQEYDAMIDKQEAAGSACPSEKHHSSADEKSPKQEQRAQEDQRPRLPCCYASTDVFLKWNCCGCWRWCKLRLHHFVMDPFFDLAITVCVILNTVFMAMEHYPMSWEFEAMLSQAYLVFTAIFTAEVLIKLLAMGPYLYFQVGWNIFDSVIVTFNLLELFLDLGQARLYLVMRVFKLAKSWPTFNILIKTTGKSALALRHVILLLAFVVFTFSVLGMHLFGNDYKAYVCRISMDCTLPRWHMSDFFHAFLLVFRVICGEWIETLWDCMDVAGQTRCLIIYMILLVVGKLLVLNLFLAFLIRSSNRGHQEGEPNLYIAIHRITKAVILTKSWLLRHPWLGKKKHLCRNPPEFSNDDAAHKEFLALTFGSPEEPPSQREESSQQKQADVQVDDDDAAECSDMKTSQGGRRICLNVRRACACLLENKYFEGFVTFMILLSSGALVFEDIYLEKRLLIKTILEYAERVFIFVFVVELLLRWFADGFRKFFTNPWCWLDFLVVGTFPGLLTANALGFSPLGAIKCLRPLRVLCRFEGMKVALKTLFGAIPSCLDVLLACLTLCLVFAIVGVNLFAGKFHYCFNATSNEVFHSSQVNNKSECLMLVQENFTEVRWINHKVNFDNVLMAYLALLQVATIKGWLDLMYAAMDTTRIESQPEYEMSVYMSLYFVFFIIFGSFLTLNFLVGAIIEHLKQHKDKLGGSGVFLTQEQTKYYEAMKAGTHRRTERPVPRPKNKLQALIFDLVTSPTFEILVMVVICLQVVALMVETDNQSMEKEVVVYWVYFACLVFFTVEFVVKVVALRQHYFLSGWNIFDFVILVLSILGAFLADLVEKYFVSPGLFRVLRLIRIGRIPRLIRGARGIHRLLFASMMSLPALFNMALLLMLFMFVFAILGMNSFAYVRKGAMMTDTFNFETFGNSMICMFTITTLAGWDGLLAPIMNTPPDCDPLAENPGTPVTGDCGSPVAGMIFFSFYISLTFLVMIHMCIIIIMENFNIAAEQSALEACKMDLEMFYETWERFDPEASQCIHYSKLSDFCDALQEPLRIPKPNSIKLVSMDLPLLPGDTIHCADVLQALAAQVLEEPSEMDNLKATMEGKLMAHFGSKPGPDERVSSTLTRKQEDVAASVIQRAYRKHVSHSALKMAATPREKMADEADGLPSAARR